LDPTKFLSAKHFSAELIEGAELPAGVFHVGTRSCESVEEVGDELITQPQVAAIKSLGIDFSLIFNQAII
jgi:acyl-CoA reductase-like NAD-dependent aldehyde dehydrogenase